jgi:hypothetical protein
MKDEDINRTYDEIRKDKPRGIGISGAQPRSIVNNGPTVNQAKTHEIRDLQDRAVLDDKHNWVC